MRANLVIDRILWTDGRKTETLNGVSGTELAAGPSRPDGVRSRQSTCTVWLASGIQGTERSIVARLNLVRSPSIDSSTLGSAAGPDGRLISADRSANSGRA